MKKKQEIKQLNKLWKAMKTHLKAFLKTNDQNDLHQFRVHVKKAKALLTLYAIEPQNAALPTYFKPVKKVFAKAGDIRNAHINLKLGEKYQFDNADFNQQQQQLLEQGSQEFKSNGRNYLKQLKKAHLILQNHLHRLPDKAIRSFYKDKLAQVNTFFVAPTFDEELHTARKNIKLLLYNYWIAGKALQNKIMVNVAYLDGLQNKIGQWHDYELTMEVLFNTNAIAATSQIKKSKASLELEILELSANFFEKASAAEDAAVKIIF